MKKRSFLELFFIFLLLAVGVFCLRKILVGPPLIYGDIPYLTHGEHTNFIYTWGSQLLGTNVRLGLNFLWDALLVALIPSTKGIFMGLRVLPILLIPISYFYFLRKMGINNQLFRFAVSIFALINPVVMGDFINGQTFWPYLILPWVYYFFFNIYFLKRISSKNILGLAITLFLCLGYLPPLIFPLFFVLIVLLFWSIILNLRAYTRTELIRLIAASSVLMIVFVLLILPYLFLASGGQEAFTPSSLIADYYHNYSRTFLFNVIRLAGNEGNGQSTLGYNILSWKNSIGYVVLLFIPFAALFAAKKNQKFRKLFLGTLGTLLVFFGFLQVITVNTVLGSSLFQSQWLFSTLRNPTKIFVVLLPLYGLALGLALAALASSLPRIKYILTPVFIVAVCVYGWPALRGDMGLFYMQDKRQEMSENGLTQQIVSRFNNDARSILIPSNHQDELNYQETSSGLNMWRLGGALSATNSIQSELVKSFDQNNPNFFRYLSAIGVQNVFLKNNSNSTNFALFPLRQLVSEARSFLTSNLTVQYTSGNYTAFDNASTAPLVGSPQRIASVKGAAGLSDISPLLYPDTVIVTSPTENKSYISRYHIDSNSSSNQTIANGYAELFDPSIVVIDIYSIKSGAQKTLSIDKIDPLTDQHSPIVKEQISIDEQILEIDGQQYFLSPKRQRVHLRAGLHNLQLGKISPVDIESADPSFEQSILTIGDASRSRRGAPSFQGAKNTDATNGKFSFELSSKSHLAYVSKSLKIPDNLAEYVLFMDYKHAAGAAPFFSLTQDNNNTTITNVGLDNNNNWNTVKSFFTPKKAGDVTLNLYTDAQDNAESKNLFDNLRLGRLTKRAINNISVAAYAPDYMVTNYTKSNKVEKANNLVTNPSFEDSIDAIQTGDATATACGVLDFRKAQSYDSHDGSKSLLLEAKNHTGYANIPVSSFKSNSIYKVSFYTKNVRGRDPSAIVWENGSSKSVAIQKKEENENGWTYFETVFVPDEGTTGLSIYLYTAATAGDTINLFDAISVQEQTLISKFLIVESLATQNAVKLVHEYHRQNSTLITIKSGRGDGLVSFNESYSDGWRAFILAKDKKLSWLDRLMLKKPGKEIPSTQHVIVNTWANGWMINAGDAPDYLGNEYQIILAYWPQRWFYIGSAISAVTFISCLGYLGYAGIRKRRHRRGQKAQK